MRRLSQMSFYITLHESEKRDGLAFAPTFVALALLLIRNVDFAEKLDSSLKEFEPFFFLPRRFYLSSFPLSRTKILNSQFFKQIYEGGENCAASKKRQMPQIGQE